MYNNIDPLLTQLQNHSNIFTDDGNRAYSQMYRQQLLSELRNTSEQAPEQDWLQLLDEKMKGLTQNVINELNNNQEFVSLNTSIQGAIQDEIMSMVKYRLNKNPKIAENVRKQLDMIQSTTDRLNSEERQNMAELNDYIKNYSHITFDEYKNIKNQKENE